MIIMNSMNQTKTSKYIEKIVNDRKKVGVATVATVLTVTTTSSLINIVLNATQPLIIIYNGDDANITVPNWNNYVKTKLPVILISDNISHIDPTQSQFYEPHMLTNKVSYKVPRLSQCDPVCRWLGFGHGDYVKIGNEVRQVTDSIDKFFITEQSSLSH